MDPWDNEYKFAAPASTTPNRSTSGPSAPTARTAPTTTSATGQTVSIVSCVTTQYGQPHAARGLTLVEVMPRAGAVGGDRRDRDAAAGRRRSHAPACKAAATCCGPPGHRPGWRRWNRARRTSSASSRSGSRFQILTLDSLGTAREASCRPKTRTTSHATRPTFCDCAKTRLPDGVDLRRRRRRDFEPGRWPRWAQRRRRRLVRADLFRPDGTTSDASVLLGQRRPANDPRHTPRPDRHLQRGDVGREQCRQ